MRIDLYEDFHADPKAVLRNLFTFLAVDPDYPRGRVQTAQRDRRPPVPHARPLRRQLFDSRGARVYPVLGQLYYRRREDFAMDPE